MTTQEFYKAVQNIESERQSKLDALKTAWVLIHGDKPVPQIINGNADALQAVRGWRQLADHAISKHPDNREFTIRDIQSSIEAAGVEVDQSALSAYLKKLSNEDTITLVELGKGRRATVYTKRR